MPEIWLTPATELRDMIRDGDIAPSQIMEAVIARCEDVDPVVNALVATRFDAALADARAADAAKDRGPLHGIPLTLKDHSYETPDLPTTNGSRAFAGTASPIETDVNQRLRAAGAIAIAMTNTAEFGMSNITTNDLFGATSNPWAPHRTAGGSSGGTGAAVAAGMAPLGAANDGGGSCRNPAASCGVVGLKPSRGRVAVHQSRIGPGTFTNGPFARTVADVALLLDVMVGPADDPYALAPPAESFETAARRPPAALHIAFSDTPPAPHPDIDPRVRAVFRVALETFADLGHHVEEVGLGLDGLVDHLLPRHGR